MIDVWLGSKYVSGISNESILVDMRIFSHYPFVFLWEILRKSTLGKPGFYLNNFTLFAITQTLLYIWNWICFWNWIEFNLPKILPKNTCLTGKDNCYEVGFVSESYAFLSADSWCMRSLKQYWQCMGHMIHFSSSKIVLLSLSCKVSIKRNNWRNFFSSFYCCWFSSFSLANLPEQSLVKYASFTKAIDSYDTQRCS